MNAPRVHIHVFGCQMNVLDADKMSALLAHDGWVLTDSPDEADLLLVHTCSVREKPERKLRTLLGRYRVLKHARPGLLVGVTGCTAQLDGANLFREFPFVDLVAGPDAVPRIRALVARAREQRVLDEHFLEEEAYPFVSDLPTVPDGALSALVTIQKGCDNRCAYCVVPTTRGAEVSRPSQEILAEVGALVDRGVRDITLIGQNVNAWGTKRAGEMSFAELLDHVHAVPGVWRLRFTTSHPRDLDDATIARWRDLPRLASHLHLPVQSGSNDVLTGMERGYSRSHYLGRVRALQAARPDLAITTDLIVGFPGETDADFEETLSLMEAVPFAGSFSFKYNARPFTPAARLHQENPVPPGVAQARLSRLQALQARLSLAANRGQEGRVLEVLVEGPSRNDPQEVSGRTSCFRMVNFPGKVDLVGQLVPVRITRGFTNTLRGELAWATAAP